LLKPAVSLFDDLPEKDIVKALMHFPAVKVNEDNFSRKDVMEMLSSIDASFSKSQQKFFNTASGVLKNALKSVADEQKSHVKASDPMPIQNKK